MPDANNLPAANIAEIQPLTSSYLAAIKEPPDQTLDSVSEDCHLSPTVTESAAIADTDVMYSKPYVAVTSVCIMPDCLQVITTVLMLFVVRCSLLLLCAPNAKQCSTHFERST